MRKEVDNNSNDILQNENILSTNAKEMINMSPASVTEKQSSSKPSVIQFSKRGLPRITSKRASQLYKIYLEEKGYEGK